MAEAEAGDELSELLQMIRSGSMTVVAHGSEVAAVDADQRNVRVDVDTFVRDWRTLLQAAPKGSSGVQGVRAASRIPRLLAEEGWQVALYDRGKEVARLGRGTSALTGHVHVDLAALGLLREIL